MSDKNIQKYSQNELIKAVADASSVNTAMVKIVMNSYENVIFDILKNATSDKQNVSIKLFDGIYIDSAYMPSKKQKNNLTGKLIDVASKTKIKSRVTRGYEEKVNR